MSCFAVLLENNNSENKNYLELLSFWKKNRDRDRQI